MHPVTSCKWHNINLQTVRIAFYMGQDIQDWTSEICGRQPLKNFNFFKGCLPHILWGPLPLISLRCMNKTDSSILCSPKIEKHASGPNSFEKPLDFVTGWSHVSIGVCPGFRNVANFLLMLGLKFVDNSMIVYMPLLSFSVLLN